MACQRSLILDYDVQDALLAGGQSWKRITWHPITKRQIETRKASLFLFSFISVSLNCSISACSGWVNRRIERLVLLRNTQLVVLSLVSWPHMWQVRSCAAFFDRFHPLKMYFFPDVVIANKLQNQHYEKLSHRDVTLTFEDAMGPLLIYFPHCWIKYAHPRLLFCFFLIYWIYLEGALRVDDAPRLDPVASYIADRQLAGRVGLLLTVFFPVWIDYII